MAKIKQNKFIHEDGLFYRSRFISQFEKAEILNWLKTLSPLWEMRFSKSNPPPEGDTQRPLLRPVYWLKNWQFACLNYYHPPKGIQYRCLEAEDYPDFLKKIILKIEETVKFVIKKNDIPKDWQLNTCLINFYGTSIDPKTLKKTDTARVGEHKDFEPGPVASISFGEKAFFQFVLGKKELKNNIVREFWLEDSSLQIFSGETYKEKLFHRVQRVENKLKPNFGLNINHFETRRINFTFRFVPKEHIIPFEKFPKNLQEDIFPYIEELGKNSKFFHNIIKNQS